MKKRKYIAQPSRHLYGLHSYRPQLSTNQRARNRLIIVTNVHIMVNPLTMFRYRKANHFIDAAKLLFKVSIGQNLLFVCFLLTTILCLHPYTATAHIEHLLDNFWLQDLFSCFTIIFIPILVKSRSPLKFRTPRQTPFERRNCTFLLLYWQVLFLNYIMTIKMTMTFFMPPTPLPPQKKQ